MHTKHLSVQLTDLPDEILMIIFRKLDNIQLLYSLMNVNPHFGNILDEPIFTNHLTLTRFIPSRLVAPHCSISYYAYPLLDPILDRFCLHILPKIHEKVRWLSLESSSMERILLAANYPNLVCIGLYNITAEKALQVFSDQHLFTCTYKNKILSLIIDMNILEQESSMTLVNTNGERLRPCDMYTNLFTHIIDIFPNLQILDFGPSSIRFQYLSFNKFPPTVISSKILKLCVTLENFQDCLYLLDGRFNQLRLLHVHILSTCSSHLISNHEKKLPNLNSFALYCHYDMDHSDEDILILPLLHRMFNLEKLDLSLLIVNEKPFIDGHYLTLNIINHLPLLNKFTFNICSNTSFYNKHMIPSNEYIQETFRRFPNKQIISSVDYFEQSKCSQCHFYSYPYPDQLNYYYGITNNFPGGIFKLIRKVSLYDERPFEHEFFVRISHSFPFVELLIIQNKTPQKDKRLRKSQNLSIIKFPYLATLGLYDAHKDYYKQFLFENKLCLPNDITLKMDYRIVKKVTHNF